MGRVLNINKLFRPHMHIEAACHVHGVNSDTINIMHSCFRTHFLTFKCATASYVLVLFCSVLCVMAEGSSRSHTPV